MTRLLALPVQVCRNLPSWSGWHPWRDWLAGAVVLAGAGALVWFGGGLSLFQQVAVWGAFLLIVLVLARQGWFAVLGPVFFYDLVRTARQSRFILFRTTYATSLPLIMLVVLMFWLAGDGKQIEDFFAEPYLPPSEAAGFALSFFLTFMVLQAIAIFFFTPVFVSAAISQERERRTVELLLATDLGNREIVFGLAAARLAHLVLLLLAGLPLLSLLQFLGGIDSELVLAGYGLLGLTLLSLAGLSLVTSLYARKPSQALLRTYFLVAAYLALSSLSWLLLLPSVGLANFPWTATWNRGVTLTDVVEAINVGNLGAVVVGLGNGVLSGKALSGLLPVALRNYAWFHGLIAAGCLLWVLARFRAVVVAQEGTSTREATTRRRIGRVRRGFGLWEPPAVSDQPVLWKALFIDGASRRGLWGWLGLGLILAIILFPIIHIIYFYGRFTALGPADRYAELVNLWVRGVTVVLGCAAFLAVAMHAAGSVSGERERQTLDGLLATPLELRAILREKWLGSLLSPRRIGGLVVLVWIWGVWAGGVHPLAVPCAVLAWALFAGGLVSVGLWLSVAARTNRQATFWVLVAVGSLLACTSLAVFDAIDRWLSPAAACLLSPPLALGLLAFSPGEYGNSSIILGERRS